MPLLTIRVRVVLVSCKLRPTVIGELLLLLVALKFNFGETSMAININKVRITTEAAKYFFNLNSDDAYNVVYK